MSEADGMVEQMREAMRAEMWKHGIQFGKDEMTDIARAAFGAVKGEISRLRSAAQWADAYDHLIAALEETHGLEVHSLSLDGALKIIRARGVSCENGVNTQIFETLPDKNTMGISPLLDLLK